MLIAYGRGLGAVPVYGAMIDAPVVECARTAPKPVSAIRTRLGATHPFRGKCRSASVEYHDDPTGRIASLKS